MEKTSFTERLTQERKSRGYTQKQVAEALGVSNRTYSKWETGENEMDISTLCRLAEIYRLSPAAFFVEGQSNPLLRRELSSLHFAEAAQRCHVWMSEMYEGLFESIRSSESGETVTPPPESEVKGTSRAEYPGGALFLRHQGADANLHLLLMPSEEGYGWLRSESEDLSAFFSLLCIPRLLEPLLEFETGGRWNCWTPAYLAEKSSLSPEEAAQALEALERWGLCSRMEARTSVGDTLFTGGETRLLRAILTLAHLQVSSMRSERRKE